MKYQTCVSFSEPNNISLLELFEVNCTNVYVVCSINEGHSFFRVTLSKRIFSTTEKKFETLNFCSQHAKDLLFVRVFVEDV